MKFQIKDKRLILIDRSMRLVGDNEYEFEFLFDEEWEGKIKTARFILGDYKQDMILDNNKCVIDKNFFKGGSLKIGVYSSNVATEVLKQKVKSSILEEDGEEPTVPEDLWTQLIDIVEADVQYIRESIDTLNNAVTETEAHLNGLKTTLDDQEAKILNLKSDAETTIANANKAVNEVQKTNALMEQAGQTVNQTNSSVLEAEASRVLAERERVQAESLRASAETERASSETVRKATETERVNAESERASAEQNRTNAENLRVEAESSREAAEQSRANAESERVSAEQNRANAEQSRATAETNRANAESERASAEQERATAENERAKFYDGFNERIGSLKDDLTGLQTVVDSKADKTELAKTNLYLDVLYKLNKGQTYDVLEQESKAYSVDVPSGSKYVSIDKVGGHSEVVDGEIISSQTDRVDVRGKNLLPIPTAPTKTENGVTWTNNGDGTISVSGVASGYSRLAVNEYSPISLEDGTYMLSGLGDVKNVVWEALNFYDADKNLVIAFDNRIGGYSADRSLDISNANKIRFFSLAIKRNDNISVSGNVKPMLEKGSTATAYSPYSLQQITTNFPVLNSAGSVYDYIDLNEGKLHRRVGVVDLGTLDWTYYAHCFYSNDINGCKTYKENDKNTICQVYVHNSTAWGQDTNDKVFCIQSSKVWIRDSAYTDVTVFKNAMQGVMLYYELYEPIVTDIEIPTELAEWIEVETGGTITFHNADEGKRLLIPNKETFIRKLDEVSV